MKDKCQSARKYLQHIYRQKAISLNAQRTIKKGREKDQPPYRKIHKKQIYKHMINMKNLQIHSWLEKSKLKQH